MHTSKKVIVLALIGVALLVVVAAAPWPIIYFPLIGLVFGIVFGTRRLSWSSGLVLAVIAAVARLIVPVAMAGQLNSFLDGVTNDWQLAVLLLVIGPGSGYAAGYWLGARAIDRNNGLAENRSERSRETRQIPYAKGSQ